MDPMVALVVSLAGAAFAMRAYLLKRSEAGE